MARRQHLVLLLLLTMVLAGISAQVPDQQASAAATADSASGGVFVPVTPTRLLQATSGAAGNMTAGETRSIQVLGAGGIPSTGVSAVVVDLGAHGTNATTSSYLTAWPSGITRPVVVSMYYTQENAPRSNTAIVEVGANGKINLYNYTGTTSVTVDVQGYFTSTSSESSTGGFNVMDPSRIANTAGWEHGDGVPNQMLGVGQALDIQAEGLAGIPATATALFVNVEIRDGTTVGTTWIGAGGSTQTWPVSMEYGDSGPYSQGRTVPLDSQGRIRIKNLSGSSINIKVDVQGYFTDAAGVGSAFNPLTPTNVYSTSAAGEVDLGGGQTRTVSIAGKGGIPADGAAAVALTISVKNWTSTGTVGVFPADIAWPGNSTVAFVAGQGAPSNGTSATTIVRLTGGQVRIHNTATQPVQFTLVAQGWFGDGVAPPKPAVTSLNVTNDEYVDPLPPGHAFALSSNDPTVVRFLVSRDGGSEETVTAAGGQASYSWAPGFGRHSLSVIAQDQAGNKSAAEVVRFSVREFNELAAPLVLVELTLAPDETRATDVADLPGVSWEDVETIVGNLEAHAWANGQGGSVFLANGNGGFPVEPSVSWSPTQAPSAGAGSNVVAELNQENQLVLRNTSSSSVSVKLTATGWWRFDQMSEEDDSAEDELEQADEAGGSGDGNLPEPETTQTCSTTENPEIIYCQSDGQTENPPTAMREAGQSAQASSGQPWPKTPYCDDETGSRPGWTTYRFRACNYTFKTGKMYLVSRSGVRKVGEWDFGVFQTVWTGHLTRKVVTKIEIKIWEQRGSVKAGTLTPVVQYTCTPECDDADRRQTLDPLSLIPYQPQHWSDYTYFASDVRIPYVDYKQDVRVYTSAYWIVAAAGYAPGMSSTGTFPTSNLIRCDNMFYFNQAAGCRLPASEPTFVLNRRGEKVDEAAEWYKYFQDHIYPWATSSANWFTRAERWEARRNRRRACSGFVRSAPSKSCDEFPFAATKQGCWTNDLRWISCKPGDVDLDHNQLAGSKLGAFMRRNRILRSEPDEQFYVRIK